MIQRHRRSDQGGEAKVDRQRDGPVADEPRPARDERQDCSVFGAGELKRPVIRARGRGIARGEFAEGEGYAFVYDENDDPA